MRKKEEREKGGKAMPSSTIIYLGSIIVWLCFIVFFLFFFSLLNTCIHTLTVKLQFLDDHCYPRPFLYDSRDPTCVLAHGEIVKTPNHLTRATIPTGTANRRMNYSQTPLNTDTELSVQRFLGWGGQALLMIGGWYPWQPLTDYK